MIDVDWYVLSFLVFVGIVAFLVYRKRKDVTHKYYLFYRYDTEKGKDLIDRIAKINPKFWKHFGSFGIFVGFCGMIFAASFIINSYITYITAPQLFTPTLSLVIPIPFSEIFFVPGFLGVPFWYWVIPVGILVFFHEGTHAVLARAEKIKIKTLGLFLLTIIPGAFVEPDEKQLKKANWKSRIRIYAGGSYANIMVGLVFFIFIAGAYLPAFYENTLAFGAYSYTENMTEMPAKANNLTGSIYSVNGERVRSIQDLAEIMESTEPGDTLEIRALKGTVIAPLFDIIVAKDLVFEDYSIETVEVEGRPVIGISGPFYNVKILKEDVGNPVFMNFITGLLIWICLINIGVGVVNMLPIKPLDGGLIIETLGERFLPKYKDNITKGFSFIFLFLIIGNFVIGFV
ncbi:MAG: site-2 protease family protein [archaeon]|nr:MAG: site-2 protease family protein [archaeon]